MSATAAAYFRHCSRHCCHSPRPRPCSRPPGWHGGHQQDSTPQTLGNVADTWRGPVPWSGPGLVTSVFGRGPGSVPTHGNQPLCHWHGGCLWCRTAHAHEIACGHSEEILCPVNDGGPVVAIFASLMALLGGGVKG